MSRSARSLMSTQRRHEIGERVDAELVPVQQVRLEHRREEIVRRADRVDVAREVEVHVLHRDDLRVAGAGGAALDPEHGAERRLAQAEDGLLADGAEPLRERDRGRRLALAELRRRDRGDADELRVRPVGEPLEHGQRDLRLVLPVLVDLVGLETRRGGDLRDRPEGRLLRDLERGRCLRRHRTPFYSSTSDMSNISVGCSLQIRRISPSAASSCHSSWRRVP